MNYNQTPTLYGTSQHQRWNSYLAEYYPGQPMFTQMTFTPHGIFLDRTVSRPSIFDSPDHGLLEAQRDANGKITHITSPYPVTFSRYALRHALMCCPLLDELDLNAPYSVLFE